MKSIHENKVLAAKTLRTIANGKPEKDAIDRFATILDGMNRRYWSKTLFSLDIEGVNTLFGNPQVIRTDDGPTVVLNASSRLGNWPADIRDDEQLAEQAMKNITGEIEARLAMEACKKEKSKELREIRKHIENI